MLSYCPYATKEEVEENAFYNRQTRSRSPKSDRGSVTETQEASGGEAIQGGLCVDYTRDYYGGNTAGFRGGYTGTSEESKRTVLCLRGR